LPPSAGGTAAEFNRHAGVRSAAGGRSNPGCRHGLRFRRVSLFSYLRPLCVPSVRSIHRISREAARCNPLLFLRLAAFRTKLSRRTATAYPFLRTTVRKAVRRFVVGHLAHQPKSAPVLTWTCLAHFRVPAMVPSFGPLQGPGKGPRKRVLRGLARRNLLLIPLSNARELALFPNFEGTQSARMQSPPWGTGSPVYSGRTGSSAVIREHSELRPLGRWAGFNSNQGALKAGSKSSRSSVFPKETQLVG
jgi:hypothetical protein